MSARERLPNRRQCESFEFRHAGLAFTLCAGFYQWGARPWWTMLAPCLMPRLPLPQLGRGFGSSNAARPTDEPASG
jgi:hypothetical protein